MFERAVRGRSDALVYENISGAQRYIGIPGKDWVDLEVGPGHAASRQLGRPTWQSARQLEGRSHGRDWRGFIHRTLLSGNDF
jgi:hypothetical protein